MANDARKKRLESLLHREIATCIQAELRDPRLGFITVTRVELTDDLHLVRAYYTILGTATQQRLAQKALDQARGFVQSRYAKAVSTRVLPQLSFHHDESERKRQSMDELIRKARVSDTDAGLIPTEPAAGTPAPPASPAPAEPSIGG